jgi:hypothetical protein
MMIPNPDKARLRNRNMLVAIFGLFFGGMLIAGLLRFSGWRPEGMKNKGEMLQPYADLRDYSPTLSSGDPYHWNASPRTWRIVVAPTRCKSERREQCGKLLHQVDTVWQLMGKDADRVHVLWVGEPPAGVSMPTEVHVVRGDAVLPARLPQGKGTTRSPGGDAAWLVDPNGFVVLRYAPGFDPGDLRSDVARLLKVN